MVVLIVVVLSCRSCSSIKSSRSRSILHNTDLEVFTLLFLTYSPSNEALATPYNDVFLLECIRKLHFENVLVSDFKTIILHPARGTSPWLAQWFAIVAISREPQAGVVPCSPNKRRGMCRYYESKRSLDPLWILRFALTFSPFLLSPSN